MGEMLLLSWAREIGDGQTCSVHTLIYLPYPVVDSGWSYQSLASAWKKCNVEVLARLFYPGGGSVTCTATFS